MTVERNIPELLPKAAVAAAGGIVAAQSRLAAAAGAAVLAAGGNAVDAAVATGFAVSVVEPWMSGIGGGGYMVVAMADGRPAEVIDFAMLAPAALNPADYRLAGAADVVAGDWWPAVVGDRNQTGFGAIAVPGVVDGMRLVLERFGSIGWARALAPAIALAERGLPVDWFTTLSIAVAQRALSAFPTARAVYMPDGVPPVPGESGADILPLTRLAQTLKRLAEAGPRDFYEGGLAAGICRDLRDGGSAIAPADLRDYHAMARPALEFSYRNVAVAAAPGLSGGFTLCRALEHVQAKLPLPKHLADGPTAATYVAYAEALRLAYDERLASAGHAAQVPTCTTHLSVVDRAGNMVALTQTLLSRFGSMAMLPESGILMNNGLNWFDPRPGRPNSMAPGKRPLANMCPTVLSRASRPWLALGASGGRRIVPAVMQLVSFLVDYGMTLEEAFHQARIDVSGEGHVRIDSRLPRDWDADIGRIAPTVRGHVAAYPGLFASPSAVLRDGPSAINWGMADIGSPWSGAVAETG